jgi:hypothetical protein
MQRNNLMCCVAILYIFIAPFYIVTNDIISQDIIDKLLYFDIALTLDRVQDLFIGFTNSNGQEEKRLSAVIKQNLDFRFFLEIVVSFGPIWLNTIFEEQ